MNIRQAIAACGIAIALMGCGSTDTAQTQRAGAAPATEAVSTSQSGVPDRLRSAIAATLKVDESRVTPTASFKDLGANEIAMVELVMAYEREFKVSIPDADADRFQQVQDVASYLQRRNVLR